MLLHPGDPAPACTVQPVFGKPVDTARGPLVVLFLRSLAGGTARLALAATQAAFPRFDTLGIGVIAFTRCDLALARDYVPRHHLLFPLVVDTDGRHFDAWGVGRAPLVRGGLSGLRPRALGAFARSLRLGPPSADMQLPAAFVVGRDGRLRYARTGPSPYDPPDLEAVWAACAP